MTPDPDSDPSDQPIEPRPSPIAGYWYSNSPKRLSQEIDGYLAAELPPIIGRLVGLIAPHAGYRYSGKTAGYAFRSVKDQHYDLVVVISPLHAYHSAPVLTSAHDAYITPLGAIRIDLEALGTLEKSLAEHKIGLTHIAYDSEHSLEIELPFLQRTLQGNFQLLPLMVRSHNAELLQQLAAALARLLQSRQALLVASTDLSHFYPESTAHSYDKEMLRQFSLFSPEGVLAAERDGKAFACGAGAVAVVLWTAKLLGANVVKILHHSTSANETGDRSSVVGYGAAAIIEEK
jgi:AmmeMemoRadiSam system protein B